MIYPKKTADFFVVAPILWATSDRSPLRRVRFRRGANPSAKGSALWPGLAAGTVNGAETGKNGNSLKLSASV
jgi:hypothetical protein